MLKVYIGPNGYGKSYAIDNEIETLKKENKDRNDIIKLNSEIVFADEMKDTVNSSFVMEYLIEELLNNNEVSSLKKQYEEAIDNNVLENQTIYNNIMDEILLLNHQSRKKDVIAKTSTTTKEYKKMVKINSDDLKNCMGSGQKLQFLLKLIQRSNKKNIFLDEPENHTHPSLLHVTAGLINELSLERNVCVATHSPELLNLLNIDFNNLYIFNDPKFNGPKTIDIVNSVIIPNTIHIENLNNKSKSYFDIEHLKENIMKIHKKEFMESLFSNTVYIVEGMNDELFLKKLLVEFKKQNSQYSIFHSYGKPHMIPFINIYHELGIKVIPLFDKDKECDANNMAINQELKKCTVFLEMNDILEHEIGFKGSKENIIDFLDYLENYNDIDKYQYLFNDGGYNV